MPDDPDIPSPAPIPGPTPTGYQRTRGGGVKWVPPSPEHLGQLLPQYDIECLLGHGGMGAVYKGKQRALDRPVAIKILPPEVDDEDASYTQRFKNEAKIMGRMSHPAIVPVYDFGETSEGQFFFVMEFIDGTDVSKMIQQQGRLPPEHALAITAHVCDALKYAHDHGVIHRDVKPANVLINMEGAVKVADFGLAKMDDPSQSSGLTKSGLAMGTPDFVAPETLAMGVNVDGRADLYAVGVMLYQMLTGNVPRGSWRPPSVQVPGVDPRFDPIVSKAMEIDREHRYQTAGEFRRALDVILTTSVVKEGGESSAAIPKQSLPQKPVAKGPQKPMGKSAKVPVRQGADAAGGRVRKDVVGNGENHALASAATPKSKAPLYIGIVALAAIAVGAFVFSSRARKSVDDSPRASASPSDQIPSGAAQLASSATKGSAPIKVREDSKPAPVVVSSAPKPETPKPETPKPAPEKKEEPKPVATAPVPPPPAAPAKEGPQLARLPDPTKWVKVFDTKESIANTPGIEWTNEGMHLINAVLHVPGVLPTDAAIRAKLGVGPHAILTLRNGSANNRSVGLGSGDNSVRISKMKEKDTVIIAEFPIVRVGSEVELEFAAVGRVLRVSVDGKVIGSVLDDVEPAAGNVSIYSSSGGLVRDIAWQSLDVPPEEKLAAAKAMEQEQLAQTVVTIPELATLDDQFKKLTAERVTAPFEADVAKLNSGYLGGLDRKRTEEKAAGHLDSVLALEAEKTLVQGAGVANSRASDGTWQVPLPEDDATSTTTPAALKGLRQIYRDAYAKIEATRAANLKALTDPLTTRLKLLESDLTKKDRIADAKTVKEYREGLGSSAGGTPGTPAAGTTMLPSALGNGFTNSLGMKFVPVKGTDVLFCIHETRYKDYDAYAADSPGVDDRWKDQTVGGYTPMEKKESHPVVNVSWEDSKAFCEWLSKKEGRSYRLPTDREWSIAVGIGRDEKRKKDAVPAMVNEVPNEFPWGTKWPPPRGSGNFSDQSRKAQAPDSDTQYIDGYDDGYPTTAPVMSFKPNKLGLYDLGGNVWEWCEDCYDDAKKDYVFRGGSWCISSREYLLSSSRIPHAPNYTNFHNGFRCVVETHSPASTSNTTKPGSPPQPPPPPPAPATAAKSDFTNSLGMKFVKVPGAQVLFCIHETRRQDYAAYAAEVPGVDGEWKSQQRDGIPVGDKDDHPVVAVNWDDANAFTAWLSKKEGRKYRLPTDKEWSYAVGIGRDEKWTRDTTPEMLNGKVPNEYPWSGGYPPKTNDRAGNYVDTATKEKFPTQPSLEGYTDGFVTTAPVMSFKPNKVGLYDMGGNAREWVGDWWNDTQKERVLRSPSFDNFDSGNLLSSRRFHCPPADRPYNSGFRIVVEMTAP